MCQTRCRNGFLPVQKSLARTEFVFYGNPDMVDANRFKTRLDERLVALTSKLSEINEDLKEHGAEADFEERATEIAGDEVLEGLGIQGQKEAQ